MSIHRDFLRHGSVWKRKACARFFFSWGTFPSSLRTEAALASCYFLNCPNSINMIIYMRAVLTRGRGKNARKPVSNHFIVLEAVQHWEKWSSYGPISRRKIGKVHEKEQQNVGTRVLRADKRMLILSHVISEVIRVLLELDCFKSDDSWEFVSIVSPSLLTSLKPQMFLRSSLP